MAELQTSVENVVDIKRGSGHLSVSTDNGVTFTGLGAVTALTTGETISKLDAKPDNAATPAPLKGIADQTINLTASLWQINLDAIALLRGGVDTKTSVASSPVADKIQTALSGVWDFDTLIKFDGQNSDNSAPTVTDVMGSVDSSTWVLNTDYSLVNVSGIWYLKVIDSVTVTTETQNVVITYDYTPSASVTLSTGGLSTTTPVWLRIEQNTAGNATAAEAAANTGVSLDDPVWRQMITDIYSCTINAGEAITYPSKDDTDPGIKYPIDMIGESDPSRAPGDQLYRRTTQVVLQSSNPLPVD